METECKFTTRDLIKAIIILKPGVKSITIQQIVGKETHRGITAALSVIKSQGLIDYKKVNDSRRGMGYKCFNYWPTPELLSTFQVTHEMVEYLGLKDEAFKPKLGKGKNGIFDRCRKSKAMQRVLWFYGKGELPAMEAK